MMRRVMWIALGPLVALAGCGRSAAPVEVDASFNNLRTISMAYMDATLQLNRGPRSADELLPFLQQRGEKAEILRSPDDGQPYVILWDLDFRSLRPHNNSFPVLAYEQRGKDGQRYVSQFRDIVRLSDKEFAQAYFPPGHQPPP